MPFSINLGDRHEGTRMSAWNRENPDPYIVGFLLFLTTSAFPGMFWSKRCFIFGKQYFTCERICDDGSDIYVTTALGLCLNVVALS